MFNVSIPTISDEELKKRYEQIKPVVTVWGKLHYFREFTFHELRFLNYLWNIYEDVREEVGKDDLEVLEGKDFICLHACEYPGFFTPSVAEVLSQINEDILPLVKAFEIIERPNESNKHSYNDSFSSIAFDNGYHVSTVRLYGKKR